MGDVKMTFADLHAAVKVIAAERGHKTWAISVQAWEDGRVYWALWIADTKRRFDGRTADEVLAAYVAGAEPTTDLETIGDCHLAGLL